jgi:hypothetical protein
VKVTTPETNPKDCTSEVRSDLNIKKLHVAYNSTAQEDLRVSIHMFRRVFSNDFNIGFKTPATDVCSYCERMKNRIKITQGAAKIDLMIQLRMHKKRA